MSIGVKLSFAAETYRRVASPGWTARAEALGANIDDFLAKIRAA